MKIFNKIFLGFLFLPLIAWSQPASKIENQTKAILKKLSLKQKIGQMLVVAVPEEKINSTTKKIIKQYLPGGVIFFGYNLSTNPKKTKNYIKQLQKLSLKNSQIPLFISIDQEGGRVKRIGKGTTQFPGNMALGVTNNRKLTYQAAKIVAIQLRKLGVNMNLAPVLDINNNPDNPVINTRSFGSDPQIVAQLGVAYINGLQDGKCLAVGKHFPGHGNTNQDSHQTLPMVSFDLARLNKIELLPFKKAIKEGVSAIMTAHIAYPLIHAKNPKLPATCSKLFLTDILQKKIGFKGLIITDDLEMKAISKDDVGQAALKSVLAGSDLLLLSSFSQNTSKIIATLKEGVKNKKLSLERIDSSVKKIITAKLEYKILSLAKNKIRLSSPNYSFKDLKILAEADKINQKISSEAIYFHGPSKKLALSPKIIVTSNSILQKNLKIDKNLSLARSLKKIKNKKALIFYHLNSTNPKKINTLIHLSQKEKLNLVLISTDNPFPVVKVAKKYKGISLLITFSNTDESFKQLARVLNGEIRPKTKINLDLGF